MPVFFHAQFNEPCTSEVVQELVSLFKTAFTWFHFTIQLTT